MNFNYVINILQHDYNNYVINIFVQYIFNCISLNDVTVHILSLQG